MKTPLLPCLMLVLCLLLPACVVAPYVKENPDGSVTASMGGVLAARRKNTVAEIKTPRFHIKYMSEEESGEDVPNSAISAVAGVKIAGIQGDVTNLKTTTDSKTTLGLDRGRTARAGISAGTRAAENFNPNIPLPIRR